MNNNLISNIKNSFHKFSKSQKLIAQYIIDHYDKAAFMTAAKIAERVDVSESTVVRFATALGYSGYPEMQKALQVLIKNKLTAVQRIGLQDDVVNDNLKLHKKILKSEMNNLRYLFEHFDMEALDKATELILNANRVYVLGLRTSSTLSNYLGFYLDVILNNVKVLNNSAEHLAKSFAVCRKNFLFSNTPKGADSSALAMSFVETAKINKIDPFEYLTYIFKNAPQLDLTKGENIEKLLPEAFKNEKKKDS
jgi:DNA-binding MurR/RpiR family transcriptional regulator